MSLNTRLTVILLVSASLSAGTAAAQAEPGSPAQRATTIPGSVAASPDAGSLSAFAPMPSPPQMGDADYVPQVLQAYRDGKADEAEILKSKLTQPASLALAEWYAIRSGAVAGFDRMAAFQRSYHDWPVSQNFRRRIEEALVAARRPASEVRTYFAGRPPVTAAGRVALAFALKSDGLEAEARDLVRHIWREEPIGPDVESRILDAFPDVLTQTDHRFRMERSLLKESWSAAQRAAARAGGDYPSLVKARMGLFQGGKKAEKAFAEVPAHLREDASYIFSRALFLRRKKKLVEAAAVMAKAPRDPELLVDGDEWWSERRYIARELLDAGDSKAAYAVASHHGAETPAQRIEAEFFAGWIALRFLHEPAEAKKHFDEAARIAAAPISVARAAYWQGRTAEAAGADEDARRHYQTAADRPITYYGQLAREKLGLPLALRAVTPLSEAGRRAFEALIPVQALRLLEQIGETELVIGLATDLAQALGDPAQVDAVGAIVAEAQNPRAVLAVGKAGVQRGFPVDLHAYPTIGIPEFKPVGDEVEAAMVYAIARQESMFNPKAQSSAGARGLMQLMPATAKRTASRFGLGFDLKRLIDDPAYNATIGSAHLGELMDDWKGSHILTFASYNAGGGNVAKWIKAYGDPRKPGVDMVDWVERIPFYETRNYVQRVMENLAVYRARLQGPSDHLPVSASAQ